MGRTAARHNATLDGLRGVAAMAVIWFHMTRQQQNWGGAGHPFRGYLAVDFFFILSGLVIARAYQARLAAGMPVLAFIRLRVIRLYPLIVLALLIPTATQLLTNHPTPWRMLLDSFLPQLLLIPRLQGQMFPLDFPIWSLMFEVWANVFYAVAARNDRFLKAFTAAAIVCGAAGIGYFAVYRNIIDGGAEIKLFWLGAARVAFGFFLGVLLNRLLTPRRLAALPAVPFLALAAALLAAMSVGPIFGPRYDVLAIMVIFPVIIVLGTKDCVSGRIRAAALIGGGVSYPIYVLHIVTILKFTDFDGPPTIAKYLGFLLASIVILPIGYAAWRWFDEPVRKMLSGWRRRPA